MQPKKIDCTEKNLHTFIDKAVAGLLLRLGCFAARWGPCLSGCFDSQKPALNVDRQAPPPSGRPTLRFFASASRHTQKCRRSG